MTLADYLAKNYLSADSSSKKRKRKGTKAEGLIIAEDDADDWSKPAENAEDEDDGPTIVGTVLTGGLNKPKKDTKWTLVGSQAPTDADQIAADAILAEAQAESRAQALEDDDAPAIVGGDGEHTGPTMANGALAGLQTADQVAAALERKRKAERKAMKEAGIDSTGLAQETIYRDAAGRIINVAMKRAELRAKAEEDERKEREAADNAKGDVQKQEKADRRRAIQEAKTMTIARHADDQKLNDELREQERWNDPMAQLIASKKATQGKDGHTHSKRATYKGAFEPNRYGIKPGWRWDGVDRSNGFERKWFAARNKAKDREELKYAWQMDE